jgi:hypothetical protein
MLQFGSAITYLFEMGAPGYKGLTASWGQVAVAPGMMAGIIVVQIMLYSCTPDQLLLWGWRVPFLVSKHNMHLPHACATYWERPCLHA